MTPHSPEKFFMVWGIYFTLLLTGTKAKTCEYDLASYEDSCYVPITGQVDFWAAEANCDILYGGHLVAINSKKENDFITNLMQLKEDFRWRIGGFKNGTSWKWTSGNFLIYSTYILLAKY